MKIEVDGDIQNVYIFIADALRYDSFPSNLRDSGTVLKTVSSSAISCTSFSTMVSGLYPPQHGVWTFSDALDEHTIFDLFPGTSPCYFGVSSVTNSHELAEHYNHLGDFEDALRSLEDPYFVLDRELVTHAPYNYDLSGTHIDEDEKAYTSVKSYFEDRSTEQVRADYEASAEEAGRRFLDRMALLEEEGLLENTLVIVTADHGEVLGEYGMYGHAPVLAPESVYVPTQFFDGGVDVTVEGEFMAHVDLYPTICHIRDRSVPSDRPGYDLFEGAPDDRLVFNARRDFYGAWENEGGYSFNDRPAVKRLLTGFSRLLRPDWASANRRRPLQTIRSSFKREWEFGTPRHSKAEASEFCAEIFSRETDSGTDDLDSGTKDQLRALGYSDDEI